MKTKSAHIALLTAISCIALSTMPAVGQTPANVSHGIMFLPPDFYHDHREALGLSEEQLREMQQIADATHKESADLTKAVGERTQALHEVMAKHPADADLAATKLSELLVTESEVKTAQLRARLAIRNVLNAEQFMKLGQITKTAMANQQQASSGKLKEMMEQVKKEIHQRTGGGEPPREIIEQLEQIEAAARNGNLATAEERLNQILKHLRSDGQGAPAERSMRRPPEPRGEAGMEERVRRLSNVQTDDPELREHIQGAMKRLQEAKEAGNQEAILDILNAIEAKLPAQRR